MSLHVAENDVGNSVKTEVTKFCCKNITHLYYCISEIFAFGRELMVETELIFEKSF